MKPQIQPLRDGDPKSFQGWALEGLIGEGGQSTIYLGEKHNQLAAIKIIRKEYLHNQTSVERFFTEIKNLEMLEHPNIARVLEVSDTGTFVAIEYIDGPNLEECVNEFGPLNIEDWHRLAQELASTIDYCHSKGIIHKDINPSNVVLGPNGPVLIDFGISYLEKDPRLTSVEETIGTPPFMSPEHFGLHRPFQMDLFSLAGTLIFAASGHYPFQGKNFSEWKESILYERPDFSGLNQIQEIVVSPLLYKDPEKRQSLQEFTNVLESIKSDDGFIDFDSKQISHIQRNSNSLLELQKKSLETNSKKGKRIIFLAALISLLSVSLAAFGIILIQKNESNKILNEKTTVKIETANPDPSPAQSELITSKTPIPSASSDSTSKSNPNSKATKSSETFTSATPEPSKSTLPVLSSDNFKISAPLASNVVKDSIFGRAFIDGLQYWHIPLTNSKAEKIPAITSIQFRMIGYPNAGWMDVPYKLKTESSFGTVYAEVDNMLFAIIFKEVKYCPEFRVVREENGKIVQIWEKGQPECASDYNP